MKNIYSQSSQSDAEDASMVGGFFGPVLLLAVAVAVVIGGLLLAIG